MSFYLIGLVSNIGIFQTSQSFYSYVQQTWRITREVFLQIKTPELCPRTTRSEPLSMRPRI